MSTVRAVASRISLSRASKILYLPKEKCYKQNSRNSTIQGTSLYIVRDNTHFSSESNACLLKIATNSFLVALSTDEILGAGAAFFPTIIFSVFATGFEGFTCLKSGFGRLGGCSIAITLYYDKSIRLSKYIVQIQDSSYPQLLACLDTSAASLLRLPLPPIHTVHLDP